MHKKILVDILNDPDKLSLLFERAKRLNPNFPLNGDSLLCWLILENAGLATPFMLPPAAFVSGLSSARGLVPLIVSFKWKVLPVANYDAQAGDLFVICNEKNVPQRIGFVAKTAVAGGARFKAVHNDIVDAKAEMFPIDEVTYWMAFG